MHFSVWSSYDFAGNGNNFNIEHSGYHAGQKLEQSRPLPVTFLQTSMTFKEITKPYLKLFVMHVQYLINCKSTALVPTKCDVNGREHILNDVTGLFY